MTHKRFTFATLQAATIKSVERQFIIRPETKTISSLVIQLETADKIRSFVATRAILILKKDLHGASTFQTERVTT